MKKVEILVVILLVALLTSSYYYRLCQQNLETRTTLDRLGAVSDMENVHPMSKGFPRNRKRKIPEIDDSFLAKLRQQGQVTLPEKMALETMSESAVTETLHSYLGNNDILCTRILRMGNVHDGGWDVCDDEAYRPIKPCLVYSFGIQNDFSFDDYTATNYGCEVFSFDPSMKQASHQRAPLVRFVRQGIAAQDVKPQTENDWELHTVSSFKEILGHSQRPLDILKMDIEGSEWAVLKQLVQSGEAKHVRQLLVEFHLWNAAEDSRKRLQLLKDLYDLGFRKFYTHKNPGCVFPDSQKLPVQRTQCYEVHYVNINMDS